MRRIVLIAALLLVSASAQAGQTRNLSPAGGDSRPIAAPLPPSPAPKLAEVPTAAPAAPAPVAVAPPAPPAAAPETGAPPVATAPVPPPLPPAPAAAAAPASSDAPKYVDRPTVAPAATDAKFDDGKSSRRAERRHRGGYWTAGRIMGELRRYGISYGYGGW